MINKDLENAWAVQGIRQEKCTKLGEENKKLKEEKQELEYLGDINEELKEENKKLKERIEQIKETYIRFEDSEKEYNKGLGELDQLIMNR